MKRLILMFLIIGVTIVFFGCSENSFMTPESDQSDLAPTRLKGTKPAPNLIGEMDLYFTFGNWPAEPVWVGTVTFEDYGEYGMRFYHLSPFKEYSQASPFEEWFEIYDLGDDTHVYLAGPDVGVTTTANKPPEPCKYRMNGEIEVATAPFEGWLGRNVHMSGVITWQNLGTPEAPVIAPATAPGTFRIN
ncbi:MAG: hypothetical protein JSV22_01175 [Bacteroidales bacterium]|nr:MAG: hypothetical protein JSV22_01175 [Bacteroidales bacterium]